MQSLLQEKEEQLRRLETDKAESERLAEVLAKQLKQSQESEGKKKWTSTVVHNAILTLTLVYGTYFRTSERGCLEFGTRKTRAWKFYD